MNRTALLTLVLAAAFACTSAVMAQDAEKKRKGGKGQTIAGTLNAAPVAGDTVTWNVTGEDGAAKDLPMTGEVVVMYGEKNGQNRAMQIRIKGKKVPEAKGKRLVATGTIKAVAVAGKQATVTLTTADGDKDFVLPTKVKVMCRDKGGVLQALGIGPGGGRRKKDDAAAEPKGERKKKRGKKKDQAAAM